MKTGRILMVNLWWFIQSDVGRSNDFYFKFRFIVSVLCVVCLGFVHCAPKKQILSSIAKKSSTVEQIPKHSYLVSLVILKNIYNRRKTPTHSVKILVSLFWKILVFVWKGFYYAVHSSSRTTLAHTSSHTTSNIYCTGNHPPYTPTLQPTPTTHTRISSFPYRIPGTEARENTA